MSKQSLSGQRKSVRMPASMPLGTSRAKAEFFLLAVTVLWGSTFPLTKILFADVSPMLYTALRFSAATLLLALFFHRRLRRCAKSAWRHGSLLGILLFLIFITQAIGLEYTTPSKSAFITGLQVVATPLLQAMFRRRFPNVGLFLGILLVSVGLYFLMSPNGSEFNRGDGITLIAAVICAVYIIAIDLYKEDDAFHLTIIQFLWTAILALVCTPFAEHPFFHPHIRSVAILGYLVVMPTIVALYVQTKYQRYSTPERSAVIYSMEPPLAAICSVLLGFAVMGWNEILGGVLMLGGLVLSALSDTIARFMAKNRGVPGITKKV